MFDRRIVEDALQPVRATPVAHYTRIGTLCHFLPQVAGQPVNGWASAWATPVQFLNDRMELVLGLEALNQLAPTVLPARHPFYAAMAPLQTAYGTLETDAFQMSFSGNPDELGQWRGYAANGMGCSVVTNAVAVKAVSDVAGWVIYNKIRQKVFALKVIHSLAPMADVTTIQQVAVAAASFMKHEGFQAEKEFRILRFPDAADVKFRETGDRLVPFIDVLSGKPPLPVERIIIGPGWQLANLDSAEFGRHHVPQSINRLLYARGLKPDVIESSSIPFDPR